MPNPIRQDPTRTTTLRARFLRDMNGRVTKLKSAIRSLIVGEDAFGLSLPSGRVASVLFNNRFAFESDPQKIKSFQDWFTLQVQAGLLEVEGALVETPWLAKYVESAYKAAVVRTFIDTKKVALAGDVPFFEGTKAQFLESAFNAPTRVDRIRLLHTRSFDKLKAISSDMSQVISTHLADGFAHGDGPRVIASKINKSLTGINKKRALALARTEIVHAYAEGQLDTFEDLNVEKIAVMAEWSTAGDDRVCPQCLPLEGVVMTVREARGILPRHPNCLLGDTKVVAANPISMLRAKYSGPVFDIVTAKGRRLSVTEHHVLLTQFGWRFAKDIQEGDQFIDASTLDGELFGRPDYDKDVTCLEDLFASFVKFGCEGFQSSTNPAPEDLHGDGRSINGEIDIIRIDGFLRGKGYSCLSKKLRKAFFMSRRDSSVSLVSLRSLSEGLLATAATTDSFMGFDDVSAVFFRGSSGHHNSVGFDYSTHGNTPLIKPASDNVLVHSKLLADTHCSDPGFVKLNDLMLLLIAEDDTRFGEGFRTIADNSGFLDTLADGLRIVSEFLSHFSTGQAGLVKTDSVLAINSRHVDSIDVYDVETQESMYIANGILSSNCRCAFLPSNIGETTKGQKRSKSSIEKAIAKSLKAEKPRLKTKKARASASTWRGADVKVKKRTVKKKAKK